MKNITRLIIALSLAVTVAGCAVYGTDHTEQNLFLNSQGMYPVQIEIKKDPLVLANSIKVKAVVDGAPYPLSGHAEGIWSGKVSAACKFRPLNFSYQIDWKYLALFIPVPRSRTISAQTEFLQSTGFQAPDQLLLYGANKGISENVVVKAVHPPGVFLLGVSIVPTMEGCGIGDCTGAAFTLSNVPTLPQTIPCGGTTQFNVNFYSTYQSSGKLVLTTSVGAKEIPISGKIFMLP